MKNMNKERLDSALFIQSAIRSELREIEDATNRIIQRMKKFNGGSYYGDGNEESFDASFAHDLLKEIHRNLEKLDCNI